jgi:stage IV sporulation protein FB
MIHLGSIGKTSIAIDLSFVILIVLFVASFYDRTIGLRYALLWAPVLFLSILLHELSHAAAIALFGYGSSQIVLAGMGGLTLNARQARPWHDVVISAAGPVSSFALAGVTSAVMRNSSLASHDAMLVAFLPLLRNANLWWGAFNLIPVTPLDGGHVVRNFFRMFLRDRTAFAIAVWIAIVAGVVIVAVGLYIRYYFLALLIGWYVFTNFQQWQHFRKGGFPSE